MHEHLEEVALTHMNGRIYDAYAGRFLSADPFIQFQFYLQSYNRYSYLLNLPLNGSDPTGYFGFIHDGTYYDSSEPSGVVTSRASQDISLFDGSLGDWGAASGINALGRTGGGGFTSGGLVAQNFSDGNSHSFGQMFSLDEVALRFMVRGNKGGALKSAGPTTNLHVDALAALSYDYLSIGVDGIYKISGAIDFARKMSYGAIDEFGMGYLSSSQSYWDRGQYGAYVVNGFGFVIASTVNIVTAGSASVISKGTTSLVRMAGGAAKGAARSVDELSQAAMAADRGGLTAAGRALQKHGGREGSAFPGVTGGPGAINKQGQFVVDDILTSPGSASVTRNHARFGEVTEIRAPGGRAFDTALTESSSDSWSLDK